MCVWVGVRGGRGGGRAGTGNEGRDAEGAHAAGLGVLLLDASDMARQVLHPHPLVQCQLVAGAFQPCCTRKCTGVVRASVKPRTVKPLESCRKTTGPLETDSAKTWHNVSSECYFDETVVADQKSVFVALSGRPLPIDPFRMNWQVGSSKTNHPPQSGGSEILRCSISKHRRDRCHYSDACILKQTAQQNRLQDTEERCKAKVCRLGFSLPHR